MSMIIEKYTRTTAAFYSAVILGINSEVVHAFNNNNSDDDKNITVQQSSNTLHTWKD